MPLKDPTFLFYTKPFIETGAIFWKDFWLTRPDNPIWRILGIECDQEYEQESGQLVIDKGKHATWQALNLAFYLQTQREFYFKLLMGDKDTFKYAWRALRVPYHMVAPHLGIVGAGTTEFCGHTVMKPNIDGSIFSYRETNIKGFTRRRLECRDAFFPHQFIKILRWRE